MTAILRSETCACYRDDDGLHPCEKLAAYLRDGVAGAGASNGHILKAFDLLKFAPEPPKRAVRLENGLWQAPCGCQVNLETTGYMNRFCKSTKHLLPSELADHIAQAVAAVMREQQAQVRSGAVLLPDDAAIKFQAEQQIGFNTSICSGEMRKMFVVGAKWMREQQAPPMPTDEEIDARLDLIHRQGTAVWFEFREGYHAGAKWALERRAS